MTRDGFGQTRRVSLGRDRVIVVAGRVLFRRRFARLCIAFDSPLMIRLEDTADSLI